MRLVLMLSLACLVPHANAISLDAGMPCEFGAFVTETDPVGVNVRQGKGTSTKVLGRLPPQVASKLLERYFAKVEVDVLQGSAGWFRISRARDNEALTGIPPRPMFRGTGWVSGRKLGVKSQAVTGHARPDSKSKVVLRTADESPFDYDEAVEAGHLVECSGKWALVEFDESKMAGEPGEYLKVDPSARAGLPKGRFRAWLNQICGIQETSCDGLGGEEPDPPR